MFLFKDFFPLCGSDGEQSIWALFAFNSHHISEDQENEVNIQLVGKGDERW